MKRLAVLKDNLNVTVQGIVDQEAKFGVLPTSSLLRLTQGRCREFGAILLVEALYFLHQLCRPLFGDVAGVDRLYE